MNPGVDGDSVDETKHGIGKSLDRSRGYKEAFAQLPTSIPNNPLISDFHRADCGGPGRIR